MEAYLELHPELRDAFTDDALRRELEPCREVIETAVPEARGKICIDGFTAPAAPRRENA